MKKQITVALVVLTFTLSTHLVVAQEFDFGEISPDEVVEVAFTFVFGPDFPSSWLTWESFLQFIVFPFIALFAVCYGIMNEIRIFRTEAGKKVQLVVAAVMALVAGKAVLTTMRGILIVNAWLATIGFGILLIIGILMWAFVKAISDVLKHI